MKILHVINALTTGGAERMLVESISYFQDRDIEIDVLLLNGKKTDFYFQLEKNHNVKIISLGDGSEYNPFLIFKIIPLLKNYGIIHAHLFPSFYWVVLAKFLSGSKVRIVFTEHSTYNGRLKYKFFKPIDRFIYNRINSIICISKGTFDIITSYINIKKDRFVIIPNGIPISKFSNATRYPRKKFDLNEEDFLLLQISSFNWKKDQETLIKALSRLPNNFKVIFAGDGTNIENCKDLAKSLDLEGRIIFLGNRVDIPELIATADVIVQSSNVEGFGLASLEGMAAKKPVVATNIPGISEIVGGAGILFPHKLEENLAEVLEKLEKDKDFYNEVSNKCYERSSQYSMERMIENYIKLYENILEER